MNESKITQQKHPNQFNNEKRKLQKKEIETLKFEKM